MLGIDRKAARITWTVFLVGLLIATIYVVRQTLIIFMLAVLLAYMLSPLVDLVARVLPRRWSRNFALAMVYLAFVGVVITVAILVGGRIVDEATNLASRAPELVQNQDWIRTFPLPHWLEPARSRMEGWLQEQFRSGGKDLLPYVQRAGQQILAHIPEVLYLFLIPILSFLFLKDGVAMRESVVCFVPGRQRGFLEEVLSDIHIMLGKYIRALVLLCLATFTAYTLFLTVMGAQYALLLAGSAALLEFIPVIGPFTASALILIVTASTRFPHVLWIAVFLLLYRLFQDYVLSPYLMGSGVELHPLLVLFGVLAGEHIGGIPGMFFSIPVIAALRLLYARLRRERITYDRIPDREPAAARPT